MIHSSLKKRLPKPISEKVIDLRRNNEALPKKQQRRKRKSSDEPRKIVVSDIESFAGWINFACIGYFDGVTYREFYQHELGDYFEFIFQEQTDTAIYFHFGGGYDFLFLIDHAFNNSGKYIVTEFIPRGSSFLSIKIKCLVSERTITFLDSSSLLPFSLKSLGENFNVEVQKGIIDYDSVTEITEELLDYLCDDCVSLHQILTKYSEHPMIARVGLKLTRSGQAFTLFNKHYLDVKITPLRKDIEQFCRLAYQGGRTEIFKPLYLKQKKTLKCYDVNSLYPYVMASNDYPVRFNGYTSDLDLDILSIWHVKVDVPLMKIPPLGIVKDGKYIFPCGVFEGYWTNIELKMAKKFGVKILVAYNGATFNNGGKIFKPYIEEMYKLRLEAPKQSADNIIYKDMMNHLYGRFGLDKEKNKIVIDEGQAGVTPYMDIKAGDKNIKLALESIELKTFTFLPIPVFVTSYARAYNYENFIHPNRETLYYTDTDSFFVSDNLATSDNLGGLKLEYERDEACFLLPKTYILQGSGEKIIKMKGFDKKKIQNFQMDDFVSSMEGEMKLISKTGVKIARFKESLRRNKKVLSVLNESTKRIQTKYNKRTVIKTKTGWDTQPLFLQEL